MNDIIDHKEIQNLIYTVRGLEIMLDSDLAFIYGVDTKVLNQAVKRNSGRFPINFRFQLTDEEVKIIRSQSAPSIKSSRSQIVTLNSKRGHNLKYLPYAFTEQGVAMLASVLRSATAVQVSISIINAFIEMRKFLTNNAAIFQRIERVKQKQIENENQFRQIFDALEAKSNKPPKGIFYRGEIYDAYTLVCNLIRDAKYSIVLLDNQKL